MFSKTMLRHTHGKTSKHGNRGVTQSLTAVRKRACHKTHHNVLYYPVRTESCKANTTAVCRAKFVPPPAGNALLSSRTGRSVSDSANCGKIKRSKGTGFLLNDGLMCLQINVESKSDHGEGYLQEEHVCHNNVCHNNMCVITTCVS